MKILGFGKKEEEPFGENKKDKKEYENMKKQDLDKDESTRIDNYIDPDDLDYSEYDDIVEAIEENGWALMSSAGLYPVTHFNTDIVSIKPVKRNTYGNVLEIICPPEILIAICGFNQEDIDKEEFFNSPNLYVRPHFLTLKLTDDNNNDIPYTTIIGISKIDRDSNIEKLYEEFYGDICPVIDGKLKKKEDRYYLPETVILQKGEKLVFSAYWPFIDITKVELLMMADLFTKK